MWFANEIALFEILLLLVADLFILQDDRYFLSGSLDGKLRLWHIPDKKVALWNEVEQVKFITAIAFVKNGRFAVVGTYDGRCFFYSTDQLKYHTVIDVRSSRGKNARGHKVRAIFFSIFFCNSCGIMMQNFDAIRRLLIVRLRERREGRRKKSLDLWHY